MMKLGVEFDNGSFDYCFYFASSFVRDPSLRTKYEFDSQFDKAIIKKVNNYLNHTYGIAAENGHAKGYRYARTLGLAEIAEGIVIVVFLIVLSREGGR